MEKNSAFPPWKKTINYYLSTRTINNKIKYFVTKSNKKKN